MSRGNALNPHGSDIDMEHPFSVAYYSPVLRDELVQDLLGIGERQLRNLVKRGKLARAGDSRFHKIDSASLLRYVGMPVSEPTDYAPWADLAGLP